MVPDDAIPVSAVVAGREEHYVGSKDGISAEEARPRLGFACQWEEIPERTWSYTPWNLRAALRSVTDTTDIGVQIPRLPRTALKAIHTRYHGG
jgi:Ser/Thr protein kinase RdoA (MazF antagonist)